MASERRTGERSEDDPARSAAGGERQRVHPGAAAAWGLFGLVLLGGWLFAPDEATVRTLFVRLGPFTPAAVVVLEAAQVVVAPVPGQPLEIPAGWLLGLVPGVVLTSIGAFAGSLLAFSLARRYGRPWVDARLSPAGRRRVERYLAREDRAEWLVFWLMLVPSFPRDPLCYLAGLTRLSTARFALIAAIGRPVGLAPWVALGSDGVAVGVELQIALAVGAGALWLLCTGIVRLRRRLAGRHRSDDRASSTELKGERYA